MARLGKKARQRYSVKDLGKQKQIEDALDAVKSIFAEGGSPHWAGIARHHSISRQTLYNRFHNRTVPPQEAHRSEQRLSTEEEQELINWIGDMEDHGYHVWHRHLIGMCVDILVARGLLLRLAMKIDRHFVNRFLKRHPEIHQKMVAQVERKRRTACNPETVN